MKSPNVKFQTTHRKNQASIDGATVTSYDVRPNRFNAAHRDAQVAISQRPREEQSIFAALKGPNR